ncbi:DUF4382 domain-containing protein [Marinifilum sp. D737]|uniref:DUF4382 domain-containing protein n=1 Tax=Marinifilum sp. D737 TaxID=2969628 RepID=UPI0022746998|nr:DUF4382 domain-containing protein [Marinifilum sp. D737]MCY1635457.1 DUF4382 domain-containing protein [Marinifilum sp. D737]
MKKNVLLILAAFVFGVFVTACDDSSNKDATGKLKLELTDAPFPTDLVAEANVTINKIEIRKSGESEGNPFVLLSEEERTFNLLTLSNGVTANLVDMDIEIGSYDLIRLHVANAEIVLKDGTKYDLKVPSGAQTGIKIFIDPSIEVAGGLTTELLLDFNVSKSFVVQGNPDTAAGINGFIFKPTIKASNLSTAGRLVGTVFGAEDAGLEGAEVSVIAADTVYTATFTNENGEYTVLGIDAGTYNVEFAKEGYNSGSVEGVEITAANQTKLDATLDVVVESTEGTSGE